MKTGLTELLVFKPNYPDESYLENERSCLRHISEDFMPLNDIVREFSGFNRKPTEEDFSKAMIFLKVFLERNRIRVLMGGDMQECDMTQKELISYIRGEWRNGDIGYAIWFDTVEIDFGRIDYLKEGNEVQQRVFAVLKASIVMERLYAFDPVLAGTIPININIEGSDLDIICYWQDREVFVAKVVECFGREKGFRISGDKGAVVANFALKEFEVELYGDNIPSREQAAYRHMLTEHRILEERGEEFRQAVMQLKRNGMKTEPAFGLLLRLEDPYKELLNYEGLEGK